MSTGESKKGNVAGSNPENERMKKAALTRRITAEKRSKLSPENDYAYGKIVSLRRSLDRLADNLLAGGSASGELVAACANLEAEIGRAMFA